MGGFTTSVTTMLNTILDTNHLALTSNHATSLLTVSPMVSKVVVPVCAFTTWFVPSTILMVLIRKYHKEKSPGLQTILDLLIVDSANLFLIFNFTSSLAFAYVTFELHHYIPLVLTQLTFLLITNSVVLFLASLQIIQIVKALLIFEPQTFENYPDHKVLKHSRIFVGAYTSLRLILAVAQPPVSNAVTIAITGTDVKL